jgi:hypothetical protein
MAPETKKTTSNTRRLATVDGTVEKRLAAFRRVPDELRAYLRDFAS